MLRYGYDKGRYFFCSKLNEEVFIKLKYPVHQISTNGSINNQMMEKPRDLDCNESDLCRVFTDDCPAYKRYIKEEHP